MQTSVAIDRSRHPVDWCIALLAAMVIGGTRRWWSIPGLVIYTVITLNAVLFVAILVHWG